MTFPSLELPRALTPASTGSRHDRQVEECVDTVKSLTQLVDHNIRREDTQRATFELSVSNRIEEVGALVATSIQGQERCCL